MNYTKISEKEITDWLKKHLSEERFKHSLGTADCAKSLAEKFGQDEQKAYIAGLLHDCAKCLSKENQLEIMKKMELSAVETMSPKTFHAPVSSFIAQNEFGVEDKEILSAIRWHTLGKESMSTFEKIIYLADKIEYRTRESEYAEPLRKELKENGLDSAILLSYKLTIKSLVDRNLKISPITIEIYNKLQEQLHV